MWSYRAAVEWSQLTAQLLVDSEGLGTRNWHSASKIGNFDLTWHNGLLLLHSQAHSWSILDEHRLGLNALQSYLKRLTWRAPVETCAATWSWPWFYYVGPYFLLLRNSQFLSYFVEGGRQRLQLRVNSHHVEAQKEHGNGVERGHHGSMYSAEHLASLCGAEFLLTYALLSRNHKPQGQ